MQRLTQRTLSLVATLSLLTAAGCATTQQAASDKPSAAPPREERSPDDVQLGELLYEGPEGFAFIDGKTGAALTWPEVQARARAATFVIAGEQHDQLSHHRLQARLLETLADDGKPLAVGLEMVPWHLQGPLDRFGKGELDVDGLFAALDWQQTWGHDADIYRDIFTAGRAHKARFVALNSPRDLARAVAKHGVAGLDDEQRAQLPEMDMSNEAHRSELESVFRHHHPPSGSAGAFENFYSVQVLWDEAMAEGAVAANESGAARVLVLAGVGHVVRYHGVPGRILRRLPAARVLTVVPLEIEEGGSAEKALKEAVARGDADVLAVKEPREVLQL